MCTEAPNVIRWIPLLFQHVISSGNSLLIANEGMCGKAAWDKGGWNILNYEIFWCGSRKECVFEAVILCLLVIFYETFTFWAEILFLPQINMEVENRMESILFSSLGVIEFRDFFFLRKGCFLSFICYHRHEVSDNWKLIIFKRGLLLKNAFLSAFWEEEGCFESWITNVNSVFFCDPTLWVFLFLKS